MARVAICCDVDDARGTERLSRCLGLAEELTNRGHAVMFVCDAPAQGWARLQIQARNLDLSAPPGPTDGYAEMLDRLRADAAVFDCATHMDDAAAAVRADGRPVVTVIDGVSRVPSVDIVVDPNIEAEDTTPAGPDGTLVLAGPDYVLLRNDVLANRPVSPPARPGTEHPRVTGVFPGPGAAVVGRAVARSLVSTGRPFEATFVVSDPGVRQGIADVRPASRQRVDVVAPDMRLHARIARSHVVLGSAVPSAYEWLCLGSSVGLLRDTDEQADRYRRLVIRRAVVGLGAAAELEADPESGAGPLVRLLSDARERARLAETGWRLVDGLGRARVCDALVALL
jgi:hypothetical protein